MLAPPIPYHTKNKGHLWRSLCTECGQLLIVSSCFCHYVVVGLYPRSETLKYFISYNMPLQYSESPTIILIIFDHRWAHYVLTRTCARLSHSKIRELIAKILTETWHNVGVEPSLQPLNDSERFYKLWGWCSMAWHCFWGVTLSCLNKSPVQCYKVNAQKKRAHVL